MVTRKTERFTLWLVDASRDYDEDRVDELACEIEGYPGWRFVPDVEITPQGRRLRRLLIEPSGPETPDAGITTRMLREIRTGPLIRALRVAERQFESLGWSEPDLTVGHRVGRAGRDDRFYARWAAEYAEALTRSGHPVAEMAERHDLSASQVRNLVHACRKRGMLTASPSGRAGGELTARAIDLLREG